MSDINIHKGTATIFHEAGKPYTSISNDVVSTVKNTDALAIWAFLQSKSNDWTVIGTFLMKHFNLGRKRYSDAMKCLKDIGLIEYTMQRDDSGKIIGNKIVVRFEFPVPPDLAVTGVSVNQQSGKPALPLKAPLPIKDFITNQGSNQESLSSKHDIASKVIQYLNDKTGSKFRATPSHTKFIDARIAEGATPQDLIAVINRKCLEWLDDPKFSQYLRPSTLFNATKFNDYVGQLDTPLPAKGSGKSDHASRHTGFDNKDYSNGLIEQEDGSHAF